MSAVSSEVRNRSVLTALRYKGREGMWTWMLHRVTGLGVLVFLVVHVIETAAVVYSPAFYDNALVLYRSPVFRFAELMIFFSVLFHAANGLRIVVQDFWPYLMGRTRQLAWVAGIVTALGMIPVTWIMVAPLLGLAAEPGTSRHEERCRANPAAPACASPQGQGVVE